MDLNAFTARLEAARRFSVSIGAATFHLRLPVDYDWRRAGDTSRDAAGNVQRTQMFRTVLLGSVVGWEAVRTSDVSADEPDEPLPFSPAACVLLLHYRQDIADELTAAICERAAARGQQREAARKN